MCFMYVRYLPVTGYIFGNNFKYINYSYFFSYHSFFFSCCFCSWNNGKLPQLRLQVSDCSVVLIICDVPLFSASLAFFFIYKVHPVLPSASGPGLQVCCKAVEPPVTAWQKRKVSTLNCLYIIHDLILHFYFVKSCSRRAAGFESHLGHICLSSPFCVVLSC